MEDYDRNIIAKTLDVDTIRARTIELVDDDNKPRMKIYVAEDDTPIISLLDAQQRSRSTLTLSDGSQDGTLYFRGQDGEPQVVLDTNENGEPMVRMFGKNHSLSMSAYVENGIPCITMYDGNEKLRLSVFLELDGKPYIMLHNADEESQTKVTVATDGSECLILEDREGAEMRIPLRAPREL